LMGNWIQYFLACYEVKFLPVPYLSSDT
jgi:hypothetical protein